MTRLGTSFPEDFNPPFAHRIIGSYVYSNPNGAEIMLIATENEDYVWACQFGKDPFKVNIDATLPDPTTGINSVMFVQAFDKVLLLRLGNIPRLEWDGTGDTNGDGIAESEFKAVVKSDEGIEVIPNAAQGTTFANRILFYFDYNPGMPWRDQFIMTDVLDYSSYDPVLAVFRVNAGEAGSITSIVPYFRGSVVVFKSKSTHMVENFTIDPFQATQRMLNNRIGSVGAQGPIQVGHDLIFLSKPDGYYRLSQIVQEDISTQPVPISRPIQPIIDRLAWDLADFFACSAALGDYVYFAVPWRDHPGGFGCNAILVYNSVTDQWESAPDWWDDPTFLINRLLVTLYDGGPRLFALDYTARRVSLLYDGVEDNINGQTRAVRDLIETRGYVAGNPAGFKRFERAIVGIKTVNPAAVVTAISDGFNEEKELFTITKDQSKFYIHGHPPYDGSSQREAKREDYAVINPFDPNVSTEDFENLPVGPIDHIPPAPGVIPDTVEKQQSLERFQIRQNGRWCSLRIENTQGQCDVLGVAVDAIPAQEGTSVVA